MTEQEQFKACAELDGWTEGREGMEIYFKSGISGGWIIPSSPIHKRRESMGLETKNLLNYSTRDAVIGVIKKQCKSLEQQADFVCCLANAIGDLHVVESADQYFMLVTATPAQLRESLLRATNKWKD